MWKKVLLSMAWLCLVALLMTACQSGGAPVPVTTTSPVTPIPTSAPAIREAQVDSIDVQILESFPVQINVVAHGQLTEACAQLSDIKQRYEPHEFQIAIYTTSPTDRGCVQVITPFEKVIPLNVTDLPAGVYTVVVNGVRGSFKLDVDNVTPVTSSPDAPTSISGWVWHDLCAVGGEGGGPIKPGAGCVQVGGLYRANGIKESSEPPIGDVKVELGAGACPASSTLMETTTITTDLSYSFTGLKPGTYCVSIDPLQEQNAPKLLPGGWTYPAVVDGPISTTVTLKSGENKFDVNFGWDYQFLPPIDEACVYRAAFLGDVSFPDNTITVPGRPFVKTWRLRNDSNCTWGPSLTLHALWFMDGNQMGAPNEVPLASNVPPGGVVDVSINMVAPNVPGTYRSEWMLLIADGPLLGVGKDGQTPLYVQIVVQPGIPDGAPCDYLMSFLGDMSVPDNSPIAPNAPFVKIWRVRNDGNCGWGPGYALHSLVFLGGTQMSAQTRVELPTVVQPGQTVDLSVPLVSPGLPGTYRGEWKLRADTGQWVGVGPDDQMALYVQIVVPNNSPCVYRAAFLGDVTIPDNTSVSPGAMFRKTWRVRNDGTCAWGPNAAVPSMTNVNNNPLGAPNVLSMPNVLPGGIVDLSIDMVAPTMPGTYRSEWMFMVNEGGLRGVGARGETPLYAQIVVP